MRPFETRLDWARKYVEELKTAADGFVNDGRDGTAVDYKQDDKAGRILVSVHLPYGFPEDFGRMIGAAFHELRAAFDNLAYQLVLANGGTPTGKTDFPIFWRPPDGEFAAATNQRLKGMSGSARAAIERLQPFNEWPERPKDTKLWLIHELNNLDKHRIAHLACLWIAQCHGKLLLKEDSGATRPAEIDARFEHVHRRGVAEDGAPLLDMRWDPVLRALLPNGEMMMEIDISVDVALRNPERTSFLDPDGIATDALPIEHFLNAALDYCHRTVAPTFASEFE
jgi:hypothetical protein